jgi:hypothetical protein
VSCVRVLLKAAEEVGDKEGAVAGGGVGSWSGSYEAQKDGGDEQKQESHFL